MVGKIKKFIFILFFITIFIFINSCSVNAEGLDIGWPENYTSGSKFKCNKDAYSYTLEKNWMGVTKAKKEEILFKKNQIVTYTGEYKKADFFMPHYYFEVKVGTKKGYIFSEDLEVYNNTRPSNITEFISKYGISKLKDEKAFNEKKEEYKVKAAEAGSNNVDELAKKEKDKIDMIKFNDAPIEDQKKELEEGYKNVFNNTTAYGDGDYLFMVLAYDWAWNYQVLINTEELFGKGDGKDTDWGAEFDKAYFAYYNATGDDATKKAAYKRMLDVFNKMSKEEKNEKGYGGKARYELLDEANKKIEENEKKSEVDITDTQSEIYKQPKKTSSGSSSKESLDDMISDADSFVQKGSLKYDAKEMQAASQTIYNIVLTIGMFATVIVGGVLGIKLLTGGVEEKADYKKMLLIYLIGCIVIFGGFAAWKIIVNIMQNVWG